MKGFEPLLKDKRVEVKHKSLNFLLNLLKKKTFSSEYWEEIYKISIVGTIKIIVLLLEDDVKYSDYVRNYIGELMIIFTQKIEILGKHCGDLAELFGGFISIKNELVAKEGLEICKTLIEGLINIPQCAKMCETLIPTFQRLLKETMPKMFEEPETYLGENTNEAIAAVDKDIIVKASIHLLIINFIRNTLIPLAKSRLTLQVS